TVTEADEFLGLVWIRAEAVDDLIEFDSDVIVIKAGSIIVIVAHGRGLFCYRIRMSRGGRLWQLRSGVAGLRGRMRDAFGTSPGRHRRPHGSFRSWPRLWFRRPAVGRRPDAFTRFVP